LTLALLAAAALSAESNVTNAYPLEPCVSVLLGTFTLVIPERPAAARASDNFSLVALSGRPEKCTVLATFCCLNSPLLD